MDDGDEEEAPIDGRQRRRYTQCSILKRDGPQLVYNDTGADTGLPKGGGGGGSG